ncbi:MAG TPA: Wzz/FepE/Etk N-terminal domain-containing protein [Bacteroidia bacterium]|nr:Wzz/FepE/Etk N-terminal domain-containing protein [Bacteroidia bacterium]
MNATKEKNEMDNTNILLFIYKWRKPLIILTIITVIASSAVTFLIKPRYTSTVILFPATTNNAGKALLDGNTNPMEDVMAFGKEEDAEQLVQILQSDAVFNIVSKRFDLMKHYGISEKDTKKNAILHDYYNTFFSFRRTEYMSVKIEVSDWDNHLAAEMANAIISISDSIQSKVVHQRAEKSLAIIKKSYEDLKDSLRMNNDSLAKFRQMGIVELDDQSRELTRGYASALIANNQSAAKQIQSQLDVFQKYGTAFETLHSKIDYEHRNIGNIETEYQEALANVKSTLPMFVLDKAIPADKKSYPVRWIIVIVSTLSVLLMAYVVILGIEKFSEIKPK